MINELITVIIFLATSLPYQKEAEPIIHGINRLYYLLIIIPLDRSIQYNELILLLALSLVWRIFTSIIS